MTSMRRKTEGFKPILISPGNYTTITEMAKKSQIYNDVITELLNMKQNAIRSEHVLGEANTHSIPSTKGSSKPDG